MNVQDIALKNHAFRLEFIKHLFSEKNNCLEELNEIISWKYDKINLLGKGFMLQIDKNFFKYTHDISKICISMEIF